MARDQPELILRLDWSLKETMHQLQSLLLVTEHPAPVNIIEVKVEVTFFKACSEHIVDFSRVLREEQPVVDRSHRPARTLLALPLDCLWGIYLGSHDGADEPWRFVGDAREDR